MITINKLAEEAEIPPAVIGTIFSKVSVMAKTDKVFIHGFGSFRWVQAKARKARIPGTGEVVDIPARPRLKFAPFKNRIRKSQFA